MSMESKRNEKDTRKIATASLDCIFGIFGDSSEGGNHSFFGSQLAKISFESASDLEVDLFASPSGYLKTVAGSSLSNVFYPFCTQTSGTAIPKVTATALSSSYTPVSGTRSVNFKTLFPYMVETSETGVMYNRALTPSGDNMSFILSGDGKNPDYDQYRHPYDLRGIGMRLPAIGVGWGYTTAGIPFPSGSTSSASGTVFKGEKVYGYEVDPSNYVAAPIELRYDTDRDVWTSKKEGFFAKIEAAYPVGAVSGVTTAYYGFTEQSIGASGVYIDKANGLRKVGQPTDTARDWLYPVPKYSPVLPSGYVVFAKFSNTEREYVFENIPNRHFPVYIRQVGGSSGTRTEKASFTYDCWPSESIQTIKYAAGENQLRPRSYGKFNPGSGYGIAFFEGETFKLWDACETMFVGACVSGTA